MSDNSQKQEVNNDEAERSLSPVLSGPKINRRLLLARKKHRKKLSAQISSGSGKENCNDSANETLTVSQTNNLLSSIEKIEKQINPSLNEGVFNKLVTSEDAPKGTYISTQSEPYIKSMGFKTATGKNIVLSEAKLQQSSGLFNDLLNPSDNISEVTRNNKYNFLSKSKISIEHKCATDSIKNTCKDVTEREPYKNCMGFQTATGKNIVLSEAKLKQSSGLFNDLFDPADNISELTRTNNYNFLSKPKKLIEHKCTTGSVQHATEKRIILPEAILKQPSGPFNVIRNKSNILEDHHTDSFKNAHSMMFVGFKKASGKNVSISNAALKKAENMYTSTIENYKITSTKDVEEPDKFSALHNENFRGFDDDSINFSRNKYKTFSLIIEGIINDEREHTCTKRSTKRLLPSNNDDDENILKRAKVTDFGFKSASGKTLVISKGALDNAYKRFVDSSELSDLGISNFDDSLRNINILKRGSNIATNKSEDSTSGSNKPPVINCESHSGNPLKSPALLTDVEFSFEKRFINSCSSVKADNRNSNFSLNKVRGKRRLGVSSCKPIQISKDKIESAKLFFNEQNREVSHSTPIKPTSSCFTPSKIHSLLDGTITPIRNENAETVKATSRPYILLEEPTIGDLDSWKTNLENEKRIIEERLKLIIKRQEYLAMQNNLLDNPTPEHRKKRPGILFTKKQNNQRYSLKEFLVADFSLNRILNISPKNAELVHFNYNYSPEAVLTQDGALVVPNQQNNIGLSEIEAAFKVMSGVEPKLIPFGWIKNHYKWIVWKLASYERFAENMRHSLTVENVVQQLKYRYDREIDRAERSSLRKIFEKDDVPQKRMVLCVSHIYILPCNRFELELTDGWYGIRTALDKPLFDLVIRDKIEVGTKIVTCGAELLNCDGCYPLDASENVRLKINYNSTRKCVWYAKLGYQNDPKPFPIFLRTIKSNGGIIGCIKIYVARVYPVKYFEKHSQLPVWRNKKAEERRAQEWENERLKRIEEIQEVVQRDYEKSLQHEQTRRSINKNDFASITSPKTLFELYQSSKDPESLKEKLTSSQQKAILDYQEKINFSKQKDISDRIRDGVNNLQLLQRDVTPVLTLQVVDAHDSSCDKYAIFQIWKPTETHLQMIKERTVFYVYNVLPKNNGDLSSIRKTTFEIQNEDISKYTRYNRSLLPIKKLCSSREKPLFNEFDVVGLVISMEITTFNQHLWLSDHCGSLLCIKILEGPNNCLLLENLKIGQIVAASNLILSSTKFDFGEAIANHCSLISLYPRDKHLQEGIANLELEMPKDLQSFIDVCADKADYYLQNLSALKAANESSSSSASSPDPFADSSEDTTLTDYAMSMMDIDKIVLNV